MKVCSYLQITWNPYTCFLKIGLFASTQTTRNNKAKTTPTIAPHVIRALTQEWSQKLESESETEEKKPDAGPVREPRAKADLESEMWMNCGEVIQDTRYKMYI